MNDETIYKLFKALTESGDMTSFRRNEDRVPRFNASRFKTQRQLAADLGFSLGKLNYCLKALLDKGLVKAENFCNSNRKRGYAYRLTAAGIKEKAQLTICFLRKKEREYEELKHELARLRAEVKAAAEFRDI